LLGTANVVTPHKHPELLLVVPVLGALETQGLRGLVDIVDEFRSIQDGTGG